jgi:WD40 repeat protein
VANEFAALTPPPGPRAGRIDKAAEDDSLSLMRHRRRQKAIARRRTLFLVAIGLGVMALLGVGGFFVFQAVLTSETKESPQASADGRKPAAAPAKSVDSKPAKPKATKPVGRPDPGPPVPRPSPAPSPPEEASNPEPPPKTLQEEARLEGHTNPVTSLAFSPDGRWLLSASGTELWLWDIATRQLLRKFPKHESPIHCLAISSDGHYALTGSGSQQLNFGKPVPEDCTMRLWDLAKPRLVRTFPGQGSPVRSVVFSSDGHRALSGSGPLPDKDGMEMPGECTVYLWDVDRGKKVQDFEGHTKPIVAVAFGDDSKLSSASAPGVMAWDERNSQEVAEASFPFESPVSVVAFSPEGRHVVGHCDDKKVRVWTAGLGAVKKTVCYNASKTHVSCLALSRHGRLAVIGCGYSGMQDGKKVWLDCTVRVVDVDKEEQLASLEGHTEPVTSVAVSADGQYAAAGGQDHTIRLWKLGDASASR